MLITMELLFSELVPVFFQATHGELFRVTGLHCSCGIDNRFSLLLQKHGGGLEGAVHPRGFPNHC